jgi:hypothetical protein
MRAWLALSCLALGLLQPGTAEGRPAGFVDRQRAAAAYAALQARFFSPAADAYRDSAAGTHEASAAAWSSSQAFAATVSLDGIPHAPGRLRREVVDREHEAAAYWDPNTSPPGYTANLRQDSSANTAQFYDDNAWLGLDLVATWRRLHRPSALTQAERVFTLVRSGWDTDSSATCPGGVFWTHWQGDEDRNAVSTANGALLAIRLYEATDSPAYLDWAKRMDAWVSDCLTRPDGLIADHISGNGSINQHAWSYNQGAMVADGALLYRATGDRRYLRQARNLAVRTLAYFKNFRREPPIFVAIFFRDLEALNTVDRTDLGRNALRAYAAWAWTLHRFGPRRALFHFGRPGTILDQSAMVQIYATLAGSRWSG